MLRLNKSTEHTQLISHRQIQTVLCGVLAAMLLVLPISGLISPCSPLLGGMKLCLASQ